MTQHSLVVKLGSGTYKFESPLHYGSFLGDFEPRKHN